MKYIKPEVYSDSFTCPHCKIIANQKWKHCTWDLQTFNMKGYPDHDIRIGCCDHCNDRSLWVKDKLFFPAIGNSPIPNSQMPAIVLKLYNEASIIANNSPRGAAALLRLSIQHLCKELGGKGDNINEDIKELVNKGLPVIVQQSLDVVRVTGNDAVHPGQIDTDDINTVNQLFELINVIVEYMISLPSKVSGIYSSLPQTKLDGIKKRDK